MPDSTVAVFFSAPERNRSNDVYYEYHQDPNFYYLSGLREPNSILLIYKEEQNFGRFKSNEVIFVQARDKSFEIWYGRRLGKEGATQYLGFNKVMLNEEFKNFNPQFDKLKRVYYQKPYAMEKQDTGKTTNLYGIYNAFKQKVGSTSKLEERHLQMMMAKLR